MRGRRHAQREAEPPRVAAAHAHAKPPARERPAAAVARLPAARRTILCESSVTPKIHGICSLCFRPKRALRPFVLTGVPLSPPTMQSMRERLARLPPEVLLDIAVNACDGDASAHAHANQVLAKHFPLADWCVQEVLLSPDLMERVAEHISPAQEGFDFALVCHAWASVWRQTVRRRRFFVKTSSMKLPGSGPNFVPSFGIKVEHPRYYNGVVVLRDGRLITAGSDNHEVLLVDPHSPMGASPHETTLFAPQRLQSALEWDSSPTFEWPYAFDLQTSRKSDGTLSDDVLFVAETQGRQVQRIRLGDGKVEATSPKLEAENGPPCNAICVSGDRLFVGNVSCVHVFDAKTLQPIGAPFGDGLIKLRVKALAVANDEVYVADGLTVDSASSEFELGGNLRGGHQVRRTPETTPPPRLGACTHTHARARALVPSHVGSV